VSRPSMLMGGGKEKGGILSKGSGEKAFRSSPKRKEKGLPTKKEGSYRPLLDPYGVAEKEGKKRKSKSKRSTGRKEKGGGLTYYVVAGRGVMKRREARSKTSVGDAYGNRKTHLSLSGGEGKERKKTGTVRGFNAKREKRGKSGGGQSDPGALVPAEMNHRYKKIQRGRERNKRRRIRAVSPPRFLSLSWKEGEGKEGQVKGRAGKKRVNCSLKGLSSSNIRR